MLNHDASTNLDRTTTTTADRRFSSPAFLALLVISVCFAGPAFSHGDGESLDSTDWSVFIQTRDGDQTRRNRIWIVELEGQLYIRTGSTRWHDDVKRDPLVAIEVGHGRHAFRVAAVLDPEKHDQIMQAFRLKYGWMDRLIHRMRGTTFRLEPIAAESDQAGANVSPKNPQGSAH